jgi:hypothetical protein
MNLLRSWKASFLNCRRMEHRKERRERIPVYNLFIFRAKGGVPGRDLN